MGAAGDMLMGALFELCPDKEKFLKDMNALLPGVSLEAEAVRRQGIAGTHMRVSVHGHEEGHDGRVHHHGQGQEFSIASSAASPPRFAPYPTLVGTAITGQPTNPRL